MSSRQSFFLLLVCFIVCVSAGLLATSRASGTAAAMTADSANHAKPTTGGLREVVDVRYKKRYEDWKNEFLSADIGRVQWELYNRHPHLLLTITVADGILTLVELQLDTGLR